ncbi:hypothetical protein [Flavobacterium sp.]|jgi:hypothetical protein|uniref:hypothetical protein n=1 Tax=Flavobacterium sp. TaxID=239 RepID=UPI0037BFF747
MDKKPIKDFDVLLKGQLTVNLPITITMVVVFFGLAEFTDFSFFRNVSISFILGWISWGFLVRNWILWAKKNDVSDERLLKIGKPGLVVWSIHTIETVTKKNKYPWI